MAGFTYREAAAFWRDQASGIGAGWRHLIVAEESGRLVGTVVLTLAPQPKIENEKEEPQTVSYDELVKSWQSETSADGQKASAN